jgi:O-antigen ligase
VLPSVAKIINAIKQRPALSGFIFGLFIFGLLLVYFFAGRVAILLMVACALPVLLIPIKYPIIGLYLSAFTLTGGLFALIPHIEVITPIATYLFVIVNKIMRGDYTWRLPGISWLILLLCGWTLAGLVWIPLIPTSEVYLLFFITNALNLLLVWELIRTPKQFRGLIMCIAAGLIFTAGSSVYGLFDFIFHGVDVTDANSVEKLKSFRFCGHWPHPNGLANGLMPFVALMIPFLRIEFSGWIRRVALAALICGILAIGLSLSRTGIVTLVLALIIAIWVSQYRVSLYTMICVAATILILLLPQNLTERISSFGSGKHDASLGERHFVWSATEQAAEDWFPIGGGLGAFDLYAKQYMNPTHFVINSHNTYLQMFLEFGLPGFLLFAAIFASMLWILRKPHAVYPEDPFKRQMRIALFASLLGIMIGNFYEYLFYFNHQWMFFAIVTVYPYVYAYEGSKERPAESLTDPSDSHLLPA